MVPSILNAADNINNEVVNDLIVDVTILNLAKFLKLWSANLSNCRKATTISVINIPIPTKAEPNLSGFISDRTNNEPANTAIALAIFINASAFIVNCRACKLSFKLPIINDRFPVILFALAFLKNKSNVFVTFLIFNIIPLNTPVLNTSRAALISPVLNASPNILVNSCNIFPNVVNTLFIPFTSPSNTLKCFVNSLNLLENPSNIFTNPCITLLNILDCLIASDSLVTQAPKALVIPNIPPGIPVRLLNICPNPLTRELIKDIPVFNTENTPLNVFFKLVAVFSLNLNPAVNSLNCLVYLTRVSTDFGGNISLKASLIGLITEDIKDKVLPMPNNIFLTPPNSKNFTIFWNTLVSFSFNEFIGPSK